jgi:hypothetical protein
LRYVDSEERHINACVPGDLKPGNILLENAEAPYRIRVADFGVTSAKAEPSDEQRVGLLPLSVALQIQRCCMFPKILRALRVVARFSRPVSFNLKHDATDRRANGRVFASVRADTRRL